jgi:hypothetical protein
MNRLIKIIIASLFLITNTAHAWIIIPTGAISDLITGAEGNNCVTNAAKVDVLSRVIGRDLTGDEGGIFIISGILL